MEPCELQDALTPRWELKQREGLTRRGPWSAEQRDFSNTEVLNIGINTSLEGCPVPFCFVRFVN